MTRKPIFWIILVLLFIGSIFFILNYFSSAYPIVNLDLKMDRKEAINEARKMAESYNWGPEEFKQAAAFNLDREVQNFVELEHGGTETFSQMLAGDLYSPYTWQIRHYKPNHTNETRIWFTPEGKAYGFREKLPEDQPGADLSADSALVIAKNAIRQDWDVDLTEFELIEKSHEVMPGERVDHSFVYERQDTSIGQGKYRLRLKVSGNRFTELKHFVKIPEAFSREYTEMRSANQTLATVATVVMVILYIIGGCIIGLFLLMKQNWVLWRKALFWGGFVALLQVLAQINQWPLAWMSYDTALSAQGFLIQQIVQLVILFIGEWLLLSATFMAAESLTRKAFPEHVQLWKVWTPEVASSPGIFGRTIGGYLAVGLFLAFDIALYFFATNVLGWWVPSDLLFEPNVLATYFPWLSSIAISLHAGFWEECLFRAVPIAGAALIGDRFGKRKLWIIAAFFVQALVFGAAHASYPMQPSYARVVELIIPSIAFGLIYLYLGLLPGIIMHYAYDVVFISLPLFAASTPGIWIDRTIVIILTMVPLLIIIWRRIQIGRFNRIPDWAYNASWQPPQAEEAIEAAPEEDEEGALISVGKQRYYGILIAGIIGLLFWIFFADFDNKADRITTPRSRARQIAIDTLQKKGIAFNDSLRVLPSLRIPLGDDDRFIWQEEGENTYERMFGEYLTPPLWRVRFAQFEGDIARRAEEYRVYIKSGEILNIEHKLPESYPGVELSEDSARTIAHSVLRNKYGKNPENLEEVVAKPSELPERKDWEFKYADTLQYKLASGEPRIVIKIAGSELVDTYTGVHLPEEWQREKRSKDNQRRIITILCGILLFILFATGAITALIRWSRKNFATREFVVFLLALFVLGLIQFLNSIPGLIAGFDTAQPFTNQLFIMLSLPLIGVLLLAAAIALIVGFIKIWKPEQNVETNLLTILTGFSAGFLLAGISALVNNLFGPSLKPLWAEYEALNNYLPFLAAGLNPIQGYIAGTTVFLLIFTAITRFTHNWTKKRVLFSILIIFLILIINGLSLQTVPFWIISGLISGLVYLFIYIFIVRFRLDLVPLIIAGSTILGIVKELVFNAYPAAIPGNILAILLITAIAVFWNRRLV